MIDKTLVSFNKKESFNVGDLVVLRSGSPLLTVRLFVSGRPGSQGTVTVDWFVGEENYTANFYESQLLPGEVIKTPA